MQICIHKGTQEIGGTCIELIADNGKRLWVDIGQPLDEDSNTDYVLEHQPDAILISHPHQDHFGLLDKIPSSTPLFVGEITYKLMNATKIFLKEQVYKFEPTFFEAWKEFTILDTFKVKAHLTDHSSSEAFAFEIECDGKRIFYSGDFRNGGAKKKVFDNICQRPPKNIDVMFVEGTTIEREKAEYPDEESVENKFEELFKDQKNSSFVIGSGQNVDRIRCLIRACIKTQKILIIDPYIAYILKIVGLKSSKMPQADSTIFRVFNNPKHIEHLEKIGEHELVEMCRKNATSYVEYNAPQSYVYYVRYLKDKLLNHIRKSHKEPFNIIYSMWTGYLKDMDFPSTKGILEWKEKSCTHFYEIHTSGHASREDILRFVQSINAKKVVPIHTPNAKAVKKYLNENGVDTVELWEDNKEYKI